MRAVSCLLYAYFASTVIIIGSDAVAAPKQKGAPAELVGYFSENEKYCPGSYDDGIEGIDNRIEIGNDFYGFCSGSGCGTKINYSEKTSDGYKLYCTGLLSGAKFMSQIRVIDHDHIVILDEKYKVLNRCNSSEFYKSKNTPYISAPDPDSIFGSDCKISSSNFENISIGYSYESVKKVIGCSGKQIAVSSVNGHESTMYGWDGTGKTGANAQMLFLDGTLSTKSQVGLR